jgi:transcriptional regulator with XRE-family HTH domain
MNYSKAVRMARSIANLSQQELAKRASLNRSYISLIESGDRNATTETLDKIASALEIPTHLFTLLAVEESDKTTIGADQIQTLATSLAELLIHSKWDDESDDHKSEGAVRAAKPAKPKRPGVAAGRRAPTSQAARR